MPDDAPKTLTHRMSRDPARAAAQVRAMLASNGGRFSTMSPAAQRIRRSSSVRGTSLSGQRM